MDTVTWVWIAAGIAAMLAEVLIPGGIVAFLGLGAVLVGLGRYFGWLEGWMSQFTAWFVLSLVLLIALRGFVMRILPGSTSYESPDEDAKVLGMEVEVVETVHPDHHEGRIRFQGTTWAATSMDRIIPAGGKARLAYRDNTSWVVESLESPPSTESADRGRSG